MDDIVEIARALSDPGRVRLLAALRGRELCACQLVELLGLAASTVSRHMAVLRQAGLVTARKDGRWVHYRRAQEAPVAVRSALDWVDEVTSDSDTLAQDRRRLEEILAVPVVELCRDG